MLADGSLSELLLPAAALQQVQASLQAQGQQEEGFVLRKMLNTMKELGRGVVVASVAKSSAASSSSLPPPPPQQQQAQQEKEDEVLELLSRLASPELLRRVVEELRQGHADAMGGGFRLRMCGALLQQLEAGEAAGAAAAAAAAAAVAATAEGGGGAVVVAAAEAARAEGGGGGDSASARGAAAALASSSSSTRELRWQLRWQQRLLRGYVGRLERCD